MENEVREGFLCPICMHDLQSVHKLQQHFDTSHSAEDKAVLVQIKGLFARAKGRFLGKDEFPNSSTSYSNHYPAQSVNNTLIWEPQEFGVTRSHIETFKKIRDARIDRVVIESNKVLIRLDKLLCLDAIDRAARREYEKTLVPWVKDADVPFCPSCGDRFNMRRRRHHCRLCGSIMCTRCSLFVPFELAELLVQTLKPSSGARRRARSITPEPDRKLSAKQDAQIRCCQECYKVLIKRRNKMEEQVNQPLLVLLYEKLQAAMESATKQFPEYQKMAESLNHGEEDFDLAVATELRFKMMKFYETIDVISKKIVALDTNDEENPPQASALRLQKSIRQTAHAYLQNRVTVLQLPLLGEYKKRQCHSLAVKSNIPNFYSKLAHLCSRLNQENMLTLPPLPSLPKLEMLQKERRKNEERKLREQLLAAEKDRAEAKRIQDLEKLKVERSLNDKRELQQKPDKKSSNQQAGKVLNDGWSSAAPRRRDSVDGQDGDGNDPIMEQMTYVKEMIAQAQRANRKEEVASLTLNLEELKREYNRNSVARAFVLSDSSYQKNSAKNPFLDEEISSQSLNPFLSEESDNKNPFIKTSSTHSHNSNPFTKNAKFSSTKESNSNPLFQQICYVSKCLDEATTAGRRDEAAMLRQNLVDLQAMYSG